MKSVVTFEQKFSFMFGRFEQINAQTLAPQHGYIFSNKYLNITAIHLRPIGRSLLAVIEVKE